MSSVGVLNLLFCSHANHFSFSPYENLVGSNSLLRPMEGVGSRGSEAGGWGVAERGAVVKQAQFGVGVILKMCGANIWTSTSRENLNNIFDFRKELQGSS